MPESDRFRIGYRLFGRSQTGVGLFLERFDFLVVIGAVDTTGRYLVPEYGEFFFYLAVIAIVWVFPRGLLGRAK